MENTGLRIEFSDDEENEKILASTGIIEKEVEKEPEKEADIFVRKPVIEEKIEEEPKSEPKKKQGRKLSDEQKAKMKAGKQKYYEECRKAKEQGLPKPLSKKNRKKSTVQKCTDLPKEVEPKKENIIIKKEPSIDDYEKFEKYMERYSSKKSKGVKDTVEKEIKASKPKEVEPKEVEPKKQIKTSVKQTIPQQKEEHNPYDSLWG